MKRIVLISCSAQKEQGCLEARKLYVSPLFKRSLEYAEKLKKLKNVHAIYILSAKYGLIELEKIIKPYNTTLTYVSPKNRKADLHVLTPDEKKVWGKRVAKKLEQVADLQDDTFIILAGQNYLKPIKDYLNESNIIEPLKGFAQGKRIPELKRLIKLLDVE